MKFNLKRDIWGVVFSAACGVIGWMMYDLGKSEGALQACEEMTNELNILLEQAKQNHLEQ